MSLTMGFAGGEKTELPPKPPGFELTDEEREYRKRHPANLRKLMALHAHTLNGYSLRQVADGFACHHRTAARWIEEARLALTELMEASRCS
ncbi:MAG: hypothetical protein IIA68_09975 [Proteobacteria bacterium]|nr:hypothetical protein [Pseudomonadota bacterium]